MGRVFHTGKSRIGSRTLRFGLTLCCALAALPAWAGKKQDFHPFVIPLKPYGIPKGLFSNISFGCLHEHSAGTRMFWLGPDRIFVAFTTNSPCTFHSHEKSGEVRAMIFDTRGNVLATHTWPVNAGDLNIFPGPGNTVIFRHDTRIDVFGPNLETLESGELDQNPRGLWVTPHRQTIPLLTADGRYFEFYQPDPLNQVATIALDQNTEANAVKEWVPGDERVAGSYCAGKSQYTCSKIIVLTSDARFLSPDGEPWTFEENDRPVSLKPIGFLDSRHLIVVREERGFFHSSKLLIVRPNGSTTPIPSAGVGSFVDRIVGVTADTSRFALEFLSPGNCDECIADRFFSVVDQDGGKLVFEASGSPYFSDGGMSPDGKSFALLDGSAITIYPLP